MQENHMLVALRLKVSAQAVQAWEETVEPIWSKNLQEQKEEKGSASASCGSIWLARLDEPTLFILRTEVTKDNFTKWAFNKWVKTVKKLHLLASEL